MRKKFKEINVFVNPKKFLPFGPKRPNCGQLQLLYLSLAIKPQTCYIISYRNFYKISYTNFYIISCSFENGTATRCWFQSPTLDYIAPVVIDRFYRTEFAKVMKRKCKPYLVERFYCSSTLVSFT